MIATAEQKGQRRMIAPGTDEHCEECRQQLVDADKELGAFLKAFEEGFGAVAASHAAECWVELAESGSPIGVADLRYWRQITIKATSRMATRYGLSKATPCAHRTCQQ